MSTTDTQVAFEAWAKDYGYKFDKFGSTSAYESASTNHAFAGFKAATEAAKAEPTEFKGWYCAHCQRGVDASEVTFHEQHTECGRVITDDSPPAAKATGTAGELPPLPEEIEVGGEGWDWEDFQSEKTFSVEHMLYYGAACAQAAIAEAARQPAPVVPEIVELDAIAILREFVADSQEHDVGGGDVVVTTCEVREKAVALLKLLQDPTLGDCGCKPSDCQNSQKCKCVAATNRSQP